MLPGYVAIVDFLLALWAQKCRVNEDNATNVVSDLTGRHGRSHTSHRMTHKDWGHKSESL